MRRLHARIVESLGALPEEARALWRREEPRLQFDQTLEWYELLERHASEPGEQVRVICASDDAGQARGLLPLKLGARPGALGVRYAHALANYYCSLYAPILARNPGEDAAATATALFAGLDALRPAVDGIDLNPLAAADETAETVLAPLDRLGWGAERYFRFGNWYLEVGGRSFDAYFAGLPSQLRNTVKRKEKKLRATSGASIGIAASAAEAEQALQDYERIYAASWKQPEPHPQFVPALVRLLATRGWLRMGWVRVGDDPIAAQIWAVKDGVASIFKLAYDERFAQLSAGTVLTATLMRHALDVDRVQVVDYLTGDDAYKRDWMSHRRERIGIRAHRRGSWRGRLALLHGAARARLRALLRRDRPGTAPVA